MKTLGLDTSNYTTSCAVYDSETDSVVQRKRLLPVKPGEKGIRQSDAVFHHTAAMWQLFEELTAEAGSDFSAVGYSGRPRDVEGSYMPCFTVGINTARCVAASKAVNAHAFSHQCGHIAAALYSSGKLRELSEERFIAFHVSGGTTEMLLVSPDPEHIFKAEIIGGTLDLNAGQAIDRAGVMLGLDFPCGRELERLALKSERSFSPKVYFKDGFCSLSGLENKCSQMISGGEQPENAARYCIDYVSAAVEKMTVWALGQYGSLPLVYAGGVMSDSIIREHFESCYNGAFAAPEFSCDNAAGIAVLAAMREGII